MIQKEEIVEFISKFSTPYYKQDKQDIKMSTSPIFYDK